MLIIEPWLLLKMIIMDENGQGVSWFKSDMKVPKNYKTKDEKTKKQKHSCLTQKDY